MGKRIKDKYIKEFDSMNKLEQSLLWLIVTMIFVILIAVATIVGITTIPFIIGGVLAFVKVVHCVKNYFNKERKNKIFERVFNITEEKEIIEELIEEEEKSVEKALKTDFKEITSLLKATESEKKVISDIFRCSVDKQELTTQLKETIDDKYNLGELSEKRYDALLEFINSDNFENRIKLYAIYLKKLPTLEEEEHLRVTAEFFEEHGATPDPLLAFRYHGVH